MLKEKTLRNRRKIIVAGDVETPIEISKNMDKKKEERRESRWYGIKKWKESGSDLGKGNANRSENVKKEGKCKEEREINKMAKNKKWKEDDTDWGGGNANRNQ